MRLRHPSMRKLERWIDGGDVPIDDHLRSCQYCASRLEPLLDESDSSFALRKALIDALNIPDDIGERLQVTIDDRMSTRSDLLLVSELFGVPFRAAKVMSKTRGPN